MKALDERLQAIENTEPIAAEAEGVVLDELLEQIEDLTTAVATALVTTGSNGALRLAQAVCDKYLPGTDAKTLRTEILVTTRSLSS